MGKGKLIGYWIATALVSFGMLGSGIAQILQTQDMLDLVMPLGYPSYFLYIIGSWKVLAVIAILIPNFKLLKEWAYAGLFFVMTGAALSHIAMGDGFAELVGPVMQTIFICTSWYLRPASRKIAVI
jgi:uncharacterized membrane protein